MGKPRVKLKKETMEVDQTGPGFEFNEKMEKEREAEKKAKDKAQHDKLMKQITAATMKIDGWELNYVLHAVANFLDGLVWLHKESRDIGSIAFKCGPE